MRQFRELGRRDRGHDDDEEPYAGEPGEQTQQNQNAADDLESADEMRREIGIREADPSKPQDPHMRVDVLQDPLGEEDQTHCQANKQNAPGVQHLGDESVTNPLGWLNLLG